MAVVSTGQITITDVNDYTYQGTTAPKNPIPNVTVWIDTSVSPSVMKRWTGTAWEIVNEVVVGGRNLLLNSKQPNFNLYNQTIGDVQKLYKSQYPTLESDLTYIRVTGGTSSFAKLRALLSLGVPKANEVVSVSFKIKNFLNPITLYSNQGGRETTINVNNQTTLVKWEGIVGNGLGEVQIQIRSLSTDLEMHVWDVMYEKGNKATDWTPAPEDVDSAILTAQNSANKANSLLSDISSDSVLSPSEKQSTKKEWDIIASEKTTVETQATSLGVSATLYNSAYNSLNTYITPLLADLTTNSTIDGATFRAKFKAYYDAKISLLKAVTDKLKANTDNLQTQLDSESAKVINLENKTNFLTGTTIEGNAVATGTLLVGNSEGTNAGITGIGDRGSASVRIWAGATFAGKNTAKWLMRDDGVEEQWFNGILVRQRGVINGAYVETWYNLNGQIGKKITFSTDGKILEEWYNNGTLVYQIGQNGIYYVSEIPESFTFFKLLNLSSDIESTDGTVFHSFIRQNMFQKTSNPSRFILQGNTDSYLYNAGQNVYSQGNKQYEGFKTSQNKLANMPNGWYAYSESGAMLEDAPMGTKRQANLIRLSNGKIINQVSTFIETNGYTFNQF